MYKYVLPESTQSRQCLKEKHCSCLGGSLDGWVLILSNLSLFGTYSVQGGGGEESVSDESGRDEGERKKEEEEEEGAPATGEERDEVSEVVEEEEEAAEPLALPAADDDAAPTEGETTPSIIELCQEL